MMNEYMLRLALDHQSSSSGGGSASLSSSSLQSYFEIVIDRAKLPATEARRSHSLSDIFHDITTSERNDLLEQAEGTEELFHSSWNGRGSKTLSLSHQGDEDCDHYHRFAPSSSLAAGRGGGNCACPTVDEECPIQGDQMNISSLEETYSLAKNDVLTSVPPSNHGGHRNQIKILIPPLRGGPRATSRTNTFRAHGGLYKIHETIQPLPPKEAKTRKPVKKGMSLLSHNPTAMIVDER